jgi:hypothetical protein
MSIVCNRFQEVGTASVEPGYHGSGHRTIGQRPEPTSSDNICDDFAVDVGQSPINPVVAEDEFFVIDA